MNVVFWKIHHNFFRNEDLILQDIQDAIRQAVNQHSRGRDTAMGDEPRRWPSRKEPGIVWALKLEPFPDMTWGMWTDALIGINRFVQKYPQWDFHFFLELQDHDEPIVGLGSLGQGPT